MAGQLSGSSSIRNPRIGEGCCICCGCGACGRTGDICCVIAGLICCPIDGVIAGDIDEGCDIDCDNGTGADDMAGGNEAVAGVRGGASESSACDSSWRSWLSRYDFRRVRYSRSNARRSSTLRSSRGAGTFERAHRDAVLLLRVPLEGVRLGARVALHALGAGARLAHYLVRLGAGLGDRLVRRLLRQREHPSGAVATGLPICCCGPPGPSCGGPPCNWCC